MSRSHLQIVFSFGANQALSDVKSLKAGAFGTIFAPANMAGKTLNFVAAFDRDSTGITTPADFANMALLAAGIVLVEGANPLSAEQLTQVGAAGHVRLSVDVAPVGAEQIVLWWKD